MVTKKKETAEELTFTQQLKQQATAAGHYTVNLVKQTVQYAIDHPEDVMLLIATIALVDMESSLDGIEDSIETSATVDVLNYMDETSA